MDNSFEDIRSYRDEEIPAAMQRIAQSESLPKMLAFLFPNHTVEEIQSQFLDLKTVYEFQTKISSPASGELVKNSSSQCVNLGLENISATDSYMFIANHRDIVMDSCILSKFLIDNPPFDTPEITFGSNLMQNPFLIDLGKSNKMFKIFRGGDARQFYRHSMQVSKYMRDDIVNRHQSVWIAQRNGRTKDGDDKTNPSVLKMFAMSSKASFVDNMNALHITPVAVSYEYEPCDFLKVRELYESSLHPYVKKPGEDLHSIITGIKQWKGSIQLQIMPPITQKELEYCDQFEHNEKFVQLATICDQRIYDGYKLWNTNYIAFDLLHHSHQYQEHYSEKEKESFVEYMHKGLASFGNDLQDALQTIFLKIYANPVENKRAK